MTNKVDRQRVMNLLERAKTVVAAECAQALRHDESDSLKLNKAPASYLLGIYRLKLASAQRGGLVLPGFEDLIRSVETEDDLRIAAFGTVRERNIYSIYTDEAVTRLIGCFIGQDHRAEVPRV